MDALQETIRYLARREREDLTSPFPLKSEKRQRIRLESWEQLKELVAAAGVFRTAGNEIRRT